MATPCLTKPPFSAAAYERSKILLFLNGPLSVTITTTSSPFFRIFTRWYVPRGKSLEAAVYLFLLINLPAFFLLRLLLWSLCLKPYTWLLDEDLPDYLKSLIEKYEISPSLINLEITEEARSKRVES